MANGVRASRMSCAALKEFYFCIIGSVIFGDCVETISFGSYDFMKDGIGRDLVFCAGRFRLDFNSLLHLYQE